MSRKILYSKSIFQTSSGEISDNNHPLAKGSLFAGFKTGYPRLKGPLSFASRRPKENCSSFIGNGEPSPGGFSGADRCANVRGDEADRSLRGQISQPEHLEKFTGGDAGVVRQEETSPVFEGSGHMKGIGESQPFRRPSLAARSKVSPSCAMIEIKRSLAKKALIAAPKEKIPRPVGFDENLRHDGGPDHSRWGTLS